MARRGGGDGQAVAGDGMRRRRPGGGGRGGQVVGAAVAHAPFFCFKNKLRREVMHRVGDPRLSAKGPSLAGLHQEAFAESFISMKTPL